MSPAKQSANAIQVEAVWRACCEIVGTDPTSAPDKDANLFDLGVDSLGLAELVIQLEETYGEGVVTIDDMLATPTVSKIAERLPGAAPTMETTMPQDDNTTPTAIFLFAGEGAHSAGLDLSALYTSPTFAEVDTAIQKLFQVSAEAFLSAHLGDHSPPHSPVVTTAINILQAGLWKLWGRTCHAQTRTHEHPFGTRPAPKHKRA